MKKLLVLLMALVFAFSAFAFTGCDLSGFAGLGGNSTPPL